MLLQVPNVFNKDEINILQRKLFEGSWIDGKVTAGFASAKAKKNLQLPDSSPLAKELGKMVVERLQKNPLFITAALPLKIFPPLFNVYGEGMSFGNHVDNAIRGEEEKIRTDLSATLFLNEPDEYEGGELIIDDWYGSQSVKLAAGDLVLYPSSSIHRVTPVTKGQRMASFFWVQSMVRETEKRAQLLQLDLAIQSLRKQLPDANELLSLSGIYHNLLRQWSEV